MVCLRFLLYLKEEYLNCFILYVVSLPFTFIFKLVLNTKINVISQWLEWHTEAHVLLAGTVDGNVWMWKIPSGDCKTFQSHGCRSTCGAFMKDGK